MAGNIILSTDEYRRLKMMLNDYERNRGQRLQIRRRRGIIASGSGGGTTARHAFPVANAGASTTISCYLDTDGVGDPVDVECDVAGGGNLDEAIPRLTDGLRIMVENIGGTYYCTTVFQADEECACEEPA